MIIKHSKQSYNALEFKKWKFSVNNLERNMNYVEKKANKTSRTKNIDHRFCIGFL